MTANRRTSGQWWRVDGFIKARNSQREGTERGITGDAWEPSWLRFSAGAVCSGKSPDQRPFDWTDLEQNVHNKIIGFNRTYLDINGSPICKDIFSPSLLFGRIFYAKDCFGTDATTALEKRKTSSYFLQSRPVPKLWIIDSKWEGYTWYTFPQPLA